MLIAQNLDLLIFCEKLPKSVFFSIEPQICDCEQKCAGDLPYKWTYKNGVFPGHFDHVVGKGGEGVVIQGKWHGKDAAFKFSPVKHTDPVQKHPETVKAQLSAHLVHAVNQNVPFDQAFKSFYEESNKTPFIPGNTQEDAEKYLMKDLNEIFKMQATTGSAILKHYGHFRFVCSS